MEKTQPRRHIRTPIFPIISDLFKDETELLFVPVGLWLRVILISISLIILTCLCGYLIFFGALHTPRHTVTLSDENISVQVTTSAQTAGELLSELGIELDTGDTINVNVYDRIFDGLHLHVRRAMLIYITDNAQDSSEMIPIRTQAGTIASLLRSNGVAEMIAGSIDLKPDTPLTPAMVINVDHVEKEIVTESSVIDYHTITKWNNQVAVGTQYVDTPGQTGEKQIVTEVISVNGQEVSRTVLSEIVIAEAVDEVIVQGSKTPTPKPTATPKPTSKPSSTAAKTSKPASTEKKATAQPQTKVSDDKATITIGGKTYRVAKTLSVTTTAYTHTGNRTSSGAWPSVGTIAVDKSIIPMGTKIYVPGYGLGTAQDTGVSGNHIDLFMDTYNECITWGRQTKTIYILE